MSEHDAIDIDGLKVGPCMVRGYRERIAELEQQLVILKMELDLMNAVRPSQKEIDDKDILIASMTEGAENLVEENASLKERIAELEREIEELNEVAAIIDHQRDMERVIRYNASLKELEKMSKDTPEHIYLQGASTWSEEKKSDGDDKYILASRANAELLTAMENQDIVLKSIIETYTKKIGAAYLSGINEGNRRCFEIAEKIGNEETAEAIYNQDVVKYDEIKDQIDSIRNTKNY